MLNSRPKVLIKTDEQIEGIRRSCQLAARTLDMVAERIAAGVTTNVINDWVDAFIRDHGATPAPLGYHGFPKSVCTSINDVVLHGIPNETPLEDGDIVNVDVTTILDGYYGDTSRMFCIGKPSTDAKLLVDCTLKCLNIGISMVKPGNTIGHIGQAIQRYATKQGYSVVREFCGHGTGVHFHEPPEVLHFGKNGHGPVIRKGMTFTIEPMINAGGAKCVTLDDRWTTITADGSLSAQWEHTILVTADGAEILTQ